MLDREATAQLLTAVFAVAMKLDSQYYEEQMTTGQGFSFSVKACDGHVEMRYGNTPIWDSEEWESEDYTEDGIEKGAREGLAEFIETVKTMEVG